jgi:hypothetical protein
MECRIVTKVVRDLLKAGFLLNVYNGGDDNEHELPKPSTKANEVLAAMDATDDEYLIVFKADDLKAGFSWVRFVYGNDGYDVVCDLGPLRLRQRWLRRGV